MGFDVRHFVADDGRELVLVVGDLQQTVVHANPTARQRKRVGLIIVEDGHFPMVCGARVERARDGERDA